MVQVVSRRDCRGYDQTMMLLRLIAFVCLAALAAAADCAQQSRPSVEQRRESEDVVTSRYAPRPMVPEQPDRSGDRRYDARMRARIDPREARYRSVQGRYDMPREVSGDLHRAIEDAQRRHGGKVLSADRLQTNGRDLYRVKLLTANGRVRVVQLQDEVQTQEETPIEPGAENQQGEK